MATSRLFSSLARSAARAPRRSSRMILSGQTVRPSSIPNASLKRQFAPVIRREASSMLSLVPLYSSMAESHLVSGLSSSGFSGLKCAGYSWLTEDG